MPSAHEAIVARNLPLVHHMARRFSRSGVDHDELVSVGVLALIKMAPGFDPARGAFSTYAWRRLRGAMGRHVRASRSVVRRPARQGPTAADASLDAPVSDDEGMTGLDLVTDDEPSPEARIADAERDERVRRAVAALPRRQREAIDLYWLADDGRRTRAETAAALGLEDACLSERLTTATRRLCWRRDVRELAAE